METKLSKLQKAILLLALNKNGILPNRDVLASYYNWKPTNRFPGARTIRFTRDEIGPSYNARVSAVVTSFRRLAKRGLIDLHPGRGVSITTKGRDLVHELKLIVRPVI